MSDGGMGAAEAVAGTERIAQLAGALEREGSVQARELLRGVLQLHREALTALMQTLGAADATLAARLGRDPRIRGVLLLHGVHPEPPEQRVREALRKLPEVRIVSLSVEQDTLYMALECARAAPGTQLRERIEQAVTEAVPELSAYCVEGLPRAALRIPVVVES